MRETADEHLRGKSYLPQIAKLHARAEVEANFIKKYGSHVTLTNIRNFGVSVKLITSWRCVELIGRIGATVLS